MYFQYWNLHQLSVPNLFIVFFSFTGFPTDTESIDNFVQHMVTFRDMQHTNILPYIGVCLGAVEDPILVTSYIKSIDLKSHVKDTSKLSE